MSEHPETIPGRNLLTDIPGIRVGHCSDLSLASGVTCIIFDQPATASISVLGGGPGGRDTALLEPDMSVEQIDALVLSGGSAFGLDAAGGVQSWLRAQGRGFAVGGMRIPLVPQAILFDLLNGGDKNWGRMPPYWEFGYRAAESATDGVFALGSVGAGTGATTATIKGGLGSASMQTETGHRVAALVAVNALGSPLIGDGPHFWAAAFETGHEFGGLGWPKTMPDTALRPTLKGLSQPATTIGVIVTDASLTKAQCKRLAIMAQDGLARAILPAHAALDGDTIFAAATSALPLKDPLRDLTILGHAATVTMARAIARGIFEATRLPEQNSQPAWRDCFTAAED